MAIVRAEKRPVAIARLAEIRVMMRGALTQIDALQAEVEALEIDLGLANEGEQSNRDQCMVIHCRNGEEVGHCLDECTEECAAEEPLTMLGEGPGQEEEKPEDGAA